MAIEQTDINKYYLSGGADNADIALALGGEVSSVQISSNSLHNLFELVSSAISVSGSIVYKCFYVKNRHPTITLDNPKIWIELNVDSDEVAIDIGLGTSAVDAIEDSIINNVTAPSGIVFTRPATRAGGLSVGNLPPGSTKAIWVRRTVDANSSAVANDLAAIGFGGDTTA